MLIRNQDSGTLAHLARTDSTDNHTIVAATGTSSRSRRSDAIANRDRVLVAARECFAQSSGAQMQDVARRAGVGVGTLYRHFASKEALVVALALDCVGEIHRYALDALEGDDAWAAIEAFVWAACEKLATDALSVEAMGGAAAGEEIDRCSGALTAAIVELARRAGEAGEVRSDLTPEQVETIVRHLGGAVKGAELSGFEWRSYVRVVLDGLRARS
jgi:AcrR family transcriptional regulator